MSDNEKRIKPKYEAPTVVALGEMAKGYGVPDCTAGYAAGTYCTAGSVAATACTDGGAAPAACTGGGLPI